MAVNLMELYPETTTNGPVNLFNELGKDKPQSELSLARQKIDKLYPNAPDWLKSGLLSLAQTRGGEMLGQAGKFLDPIIKGVEGAGLPSASRGLLSELIAPARYAAGLGQYAREARGMPDSYILSQLSAPLPEAPQGTPPSIPGTGVSIPVSPTAELGGEIVGAFVSGGPLFQKLLQGMRGAKIPSILATPAAGGITGAALSPDAPFTGAALGTVAPAASQVARKTMELPQLIKTLKAEQNPLDAFNKMVNKFDSLDRTTRELYKISDEMAVNRELKPFIIKDETFEPAKKYLESTPEVKELIQKAQTGDYKALSDLQSDMGKEARAILGSPASTRAENRAARELLSARDKINKTIDEQLIREGHHDIAALRGQASDLYAQKMNTYFNKNLKPTVRNVFTEGKRLRPGQSDMDLLKPFMERSDAMESFLAAHPEMAEEINLLRAKQMARENLKPLLDAAKSAGLGGGLVKTAEILKSVLPFIGQ